ncbi:MAG: phosphoribosylanthranilate isomerase [Gammaproteobacteria bacterium]|nr:phosphoribosylanthranilate isomerase [Gammaproteobacteria bacterium]
MLIGYRTRVKICGITTPADAMAAVSAGADALGLVFYDRSPRAVSLQQAAEIRGQLPPFVTTVGLFVDPDPVLVEQVQRLVQLDLLQFHGGESPEFCQQFERPYIKAVRATEVVDWSALAQQYARARGLLVDSGTPDLPGGTGQTFDWSLLPSGLDTALILAGGLTPDNVADAVSRYHPYGVDVSSGVEQSPGVKDWSKMRDFVRAAERADCSVQP